MAQTDRRGLPLSTASGRAAERYGEGVDLLLSAWTGSAEALDEAIAADPEFALAHAARARLHAIRGEASDAKARIAAAAAAAARNGTARERSPGAVLSWLIHGPSAKALEAALAHLDAWPRDVVILSLPLGAFGLFAFSGMAGHDQARVDLCERHAAHFGSDDWWFQTYRGWSHTENGAVAQGRALTQRGFELRCANANAVHALAHAMFEDGSGADAEALIGGWLPRYDRGGTLHGHIAWHSALVALERGDTGQALALYAAHVAPAVSRALPINVVTDTASFLWRLRADGHALPPGLWEAAEAYAAPVYPKAGFAFADVHMALLDAAGGQGAAVERRAAALALLVEAGTMAAGPVVPTLCRAALAFAGEEYAACARL
ncbi:MAG: hypothetical protein KGQ40_12700, partial [Rhodospirillales bacterium]|nr:hypothetical protein [Rhodospirillales bacterium]